MINKTTLCCDRRRAWIALIWLFAVATAVHGGQPSVSVGTLQRLEAFNFAGIENRPVDVWLPCGYPSAAPYAVLYMHDGQMLFDASTSWNGQSWGMAPTAQALIDAGRIRPFVIVGVHNGGRMRHPEYFPQKPFEALAEAEQQRILGLGRAPGQQLFVDRVSSDAYLAALVNELKPYIDANYAVAADRDATAIAGSSMGGLISWYAQLEYPKVFGASASLSTHWPGTFETADNPVPEAFFAYLRKHLPGSKGRFYFDHGDATLDALYPSLQRRVDSIFKEAGFTADRYLSRFYPGAPHTETAWQARMAEPLMYLFGGLPKNLPRSIQRIDPPNWWTGMAHPTLELMIHGTNVRWLEPALDDPILRITGIRRTDNPNYLFVEVDLSQLPKGAPYTANLKLKTPGGETAVEVPYPLPQRARGSAMRQGFSSEDVIYLLVPDRFANGDPANDSHPQMRERADRTYHGGRHGGDIAGIRTALPYLKDLGVTAVWCTPLTENNQPAYSYHGYAATDFYRIDPRFGDNTDYRELVSEAQQLGLKFIKDIIVNHIGHQHPWMEDMPAHDWVNFPKGDASGQPVFTNHSRTTIQDPYASAYDSVRFTDGWFVDTMPDLNQRQPQLANYLIQNSIWWVEYAGLAGIREDTYSYADKTFLSKWGQRLLAEYPHFNIVGEEWSTNPLIVSYWQKGKVNDDGYVSHTPSMLDFPLFDALLKALVGSDSWNSGWIRVYESLSNDHVYADPFNLVVFEGNHDTARVFAMLNRDPELLRIALAFLATTRGIPQLLYGTEIAMDSPRERHDGMVRADFPGGWQGDAVNAFTGEGLSQLQADMQAFTRQLLHFRASAPAIHHGRLLHFAPEDECYVYFRLHPQQNLMILLNKATTPRTIELARFAEALSLPTRAVDVLKGGTIELRDTMDLPARSATILELAEGNVQGIRPE